MNAAMPILGLVLLASTPAHAYSGFADLDAIDRQVAAFTGVPIGGEGGATLPVDRRLRLRPCGAGLTLSWRSAMRDSVVVQCGDLGGWRLFVPVRRAPTEAPGQPAPQAVRRGDAVAITIRGDGFAVSQPGEALEGGAIGAWIRVRPLSPGKGRAEEMRAQVVRPGLVSFPLP
ncbi:flagella basal body P-ring formation protein FlgA [Novosphingobium lindaniclasticum]|uniref:Flagella basal body P-ring formation protein FlgA SAF domain-containing protein n=1 Tax=Novosphingobium lindaniclasticum LE124 TaxID=1096930 RepID=T0HXS8_9SPHN|nr:flagella basal body P-ring formation protein FlgA [Novosphingobium lindaniclasticum]EQB17857.1 hypothetical protein L284_06665 [Novosphingobium lindaniclasticum LE124]